MANPTQFTPQGTLNRIQAQVQIPAYPILNVSASFLGTDAISIAFTGEQTNMLTSLTGLVTSPAPYQTAVIKMHLLRTQNLSALYKQQIELSTLIGDMTIYPDSASLPTYEIANCAIVEVAELPFTGRDAGFMVTIQGTYYINSVLYTGFIANPAGV